MRLLLKSFERRQLVNVVMRSRLSAGASPSSPAHILQPLVGPGHTPQQKIFHQVGYFDLTEGEDVITNVSRTLNPPTSGIRNEGRSI